MFKKQTSICCSIFQYPYLSYFKLGIMENIKKKKESNSIVSLYCCLINRIVLKF